MIKKIFPLIAGVAAVFLFWKSAQAAFLVLTRIGTLSTGGVIYSTWTYTGISAPDLAGTATPSATVTVTVNGLIATTSADVSGNWTVTPTNILEGSNSISITSGNEAIDFILAFSLTMVPTPTATPSSLPEAGVMVWPLGLIAAGLTVFFAGRRVRNRIDEEPWS